MNEPSQSESALDGDVAPEEGDEVTMDAVQLTSDIVGYSLKGEKTVFEAGVVLNLVRIIQRRTEKFPYIIYCRGFPLIRLARQHKLVKAKLIDGKLELEDL